MEKVRLAVPDFKPSTGDPQNAALLKTFNDTLWNDLDVSGVVELVSKSFYPLQAPGQPPEVNFLAWSAPPPNAAMLAFGNLGVAGGKLTVQGWLYDVKNIQSPQVLGKQYADTASDAAARLMAHKFADEIIFRLGGGIQGIAETPDLFCQRPHRPQGNLGHGLRRRRTSTRLTHLGSIALVAANFARRLAGCLQRPDQNGLGNHDVFDRPEPAGEFPPHRRNESFSGVVGGRAEAGIFFVARRRSPKFISSDASGGNLQRMTTGKGPDVSPVWNRKTNAQIAFVSGAPDCRRFIPWGRTAPTCSA